MSSANAVFLTLKEVADSNGVKYQSIINWLQRNDLYRHPYRRKEGKKYLIRIDVAEQYAKNRTTSRPTRTHTTIKGLVADLGISRGGRLLTGRLLDGLPVVYFRNTAYLDNGDADIVRDRYKRLMPQPGWLPIRDVAPMVGRSRQGIVHWAKKNKHELRPYYSQGQVKDFIHERNLLIYLRAFALTGVDR